MKTLSILCLPLFAGFAGATLATVPVSVPATIPFAEQFVLHSKNVGRDFLIQVAQPSRQPPRPGQKWAAIYVTDGNGGFTLMTDAVRILQTGSGMAPAYVIAIGYVDGTNGGDLRDVDLAHVKGAIRGMQLGGGGKAFENFIIDELRPLIEERYPVDPQKAVLVGHSLGGLFATSVLANRPTAFSGYLISSPSLQFEPDLVNRVRSIAKLGAGRHVYISVGSEEGNVMIPAAAQLAAALSSEGSTFVARHCVAGGYYHMSVTLTLGSVALPFLLPPPSAAPVQRICPTATVATQSKVQ